MKFLVTIDSWWGGKLLQIGSIFFRSAWSSSWLCSSSSVFGGHALKIEGCMVCKSSQLVPGVVVKIGFQLEIDRFDRVPAILSSPDPITQAN
jgi:hypothetical protein